MDGKMYFIMDEAEVSHKNLVAIIILINERGKLLSIPFFQPLLNKDTTDYYVTIF